MIGPAPGMRPTTPRSTLHRSRTATKISGTMGDQKKEPNLPAAKAVAWPICGRSSRAKSSAAMRAMAPPKNDQMKSSTMPPAARKASFWKAMQHVAGSRDGADVRAALPRQSAEHVPDGGAGRP